MTDATRKAQAARQFQAANAVWAKIFEEADSIGHELEYERWVDRQTKVEQKFYLAAFDRYQYGLAVLVSPGGIRFRIPLPILKKSALFEMTRRASAWNSLNREEFERKGGNNNNSKVELSEIEKIEIEQLLLNFDKTLVIDDEE